MRGHCYLIIQANQHGGYSARGYSAIKLRIVKVSIEPALFKQGLMITLFDDVSVFHNEDNVRVPYSGQSVGDYKAGLAFHKLGKRALYLQLGTCINA